MYNYNWKLKEKDNFSDYHGLTVYSTFACGGGSSMGYKLAGYDVIGANDIDPQMAKVYRFNHAPKFYDLCPLANLLDKELPSEYYNLDILDGSPPCSTFSIAGNREKTWRQSKKFREGQANQNLSDLFFDWIKLVEKLKPKIAIAENVKGMLLGNAKIYIIKIIKELNKIGYNVQLFLINGASLGLPQRRERVFFICFQKKLKLPKLFLNFKEKPIVFKEIDQGLINETKKLSPTILELWEKTRPGFSFATVYNRNSYFNYIKLDLNKIPNTLTASCNLYHPIYPRKISVKEAQLISSFPLDYDFLDVDPYYLMGMSVPPIMMASIAKQIYLQILKTK
jgi:DNA (cytosine-5)-methyltransferase 1